jgi:hypothetical protein
MTTAEKTILGMAITVMTVVAAHGFQLPRWEAGGVLNNGAVLTVFEAMW